MEWGILQLDILDASGVYYRLDGYETVRIPIFIPVRAEDVREDGTYYYWDGFRFKQISAECIRMREAWKNVKRRKRG